MYYNMDKQLYESHGMAMQKGEGRETREGLLKTEIVS